MSKSKKNAATIVVAKNANKQVKTTKASKQQSAKSNIANVVETNAKQVASKIVIETTKTQDDVKQVETNAKQVVFASSNASSKRITIFNQSLTCIVKAFCNQLNLSTQDAFRACRILASRQDYARASVTTAMSDAKNAKYCKHVAILTSEQVASVHAAIAKAKELELNDAK